MRYWATMRSVIGSIFDSSPVVLGFGSIAADQMKRPSNATFPLPTRIVRLTFKVPGSMRLSAFPSYDGIHTDPAPAAMVRPPASLIAPRTEPEVASTTTVEVLLSHGATQRA